MKSDDDTFVNLPNLIHVLLGGTVPIYKATLKEYDNLNVMVKNPSNRLMMPNDLLIGSRFCHSRPIRDVESKWWVIGFNNINDSIDRCTSLSVFQVRA